MRDCQRLLMEVVADRPPLALHQKGTVHVRFVGFPAESWAVHLVGPRCRVEPNLAPPSASLTLFVASRELDELLASDSSSTRQRASLRYVGSTPLLDHLIALLREGQRLLDMRFQQQVFHEADEFRANDRLSEVVTPSHAPKRSGKLADVADGTSPRGQLRKDKP